MDAPKSKTRPATSTAVDANLPLPASKEELMKVTASLPYQERIRVAVNVGRKSGAVKVKPIVDELRKVLLVYCCLLSR